MRADGAKSRIQALGRKWLVRLRPVGQWLVVALVLFFLARALVLRWNEVKALEWQVNLPFLAASYVLLGMVWLAAVANWRWLMGRMGASLGLGAAWRIWFLSNIVRYIPGNVWQYLGVVYLCRQQGIAAATTLASIVLYQVVTVASGLALAGGIFLVAGQMGLASGSLDAKAFVLPWEFPAWGLAGATILAVVVCYPPLTNWALRQLFRLLGREPVQIPLQAGDVMRFFFQRLTIWILEGLAFAILVHSIYPGDPIDIPIIGASFVISWVIGFVSLLTPSGLGVREAVQAGLLGLILPWPAAVALAILSRLWLILGEVAAVGIGLAIGRRGAQSSGQGVSGA